MATHTQTEAEAAEALLATDHSEDVKLAAIVRATPYPNSPTSIRLSAPLLEAIDGLASAQHRKRGNLIQYILWEYVRSQTEPDRSVKDLPTATSFENQAAATSLGGSGDLKTATDRAYSETRATFESWAGDPKYRRYVIPPSTSPQVGFSIFYTPLRFRPNLLIVGQNPSNFAGVRRDLTESPNAEMLSGAIPFESSYAVHVHLFGNTLKKAFLDHSKLFGECVGMNVWHFQCVKNAKSAPKPLRLFCEKTTADLVAAIQPRRVLCLGRSAFDALRGEDEGERVSGTHEARVINRELTSFWFVRHPSSRPPSISSHDLSVVLNRIESSVR